MELTLSEALKAARRWWWVLLLGPLLAGGIAYLVSSAMTPIYRAEATLFIEQSQTGVSDYNDVVTSERRTITYSRLVTARRVLDETIQQLGLTISADDLEERLSVAPVPDTQLISIAATDPDPERAALIANTVGQIFIEQMSEQQAIRVGSSRRELEQSIESVKRRIDEASARITELQGRANASDPTIQAELNALRTQLSQYQTTYGSLLEAQQRMDIATAQAATQIRVADEAIPPAKVFRPRTTLNTALAGVLGLFLAAGLVLFLSYLDDTVKSTEDVQRLIGSAALGSIPRLEAEEGIEPIFAPRSAAAEAYRGLRTNLQFAAIRQPVRSLVVTSMRPGEGKTTTVANLGVVLAQAGQDVILVDADLRKPRLHVPFSAVTNRRGLTNLLLADDGTPWEPLLQQTEVPGLRVMTTGPIPPNPADILSAPRLRQTLEEMSASVDLVLIDTPPLAVSDALILGGLTDGVLLVVQSGAARSKELLHAVQELTRTGKPLLGVVLNRTSLSEQSYYYYRTYYGPDVDSADEVGLSGATGQWTTPVKGNGRFRLRRAARLPDSRG